MAKIKRLFTWVNIKGILLAVERGIYSQAFLNLIMAFTLILTMLYTITVIKDFEVSNRPYLSISDVITRPTPAGISIVAKINNPGKAPALLYRTELGYLNSEPTNIRDRSEIIFPQDALYLDMLSLNLAGFREDQEFFTRLRYKSVIKDLEGPDNYCIQYYFKYTTKTDQLGLQRINSTLCD